MPADTSEQEQRAPLRGRGLAHHDQLAHPAAAAAVLLGEVHREEAGCGHRLPELLGATAGARLLAEPVVPEPGRHVARGRAEHRVLVGLGEVHVSRPSSGSSGGAIGMLASWHVHWHRVP